MWTSTSPSAKIPSLMSDPRAFLGTEGFVGLLAVVVHAIVRVLRSGGVNAILARFKVKPIPKLWIPWLALVFGVAAGVLDAYLAGVPRTEFLRAALEGLIAGGLAIAGYELGPGTLKRIKEAREVVAGATVPEAPDEPAEDPRVDKETKPE